MTTACKLCGAPALSRRWLRFRLPLCADKYACLWRQSESFLRAKGVSDEQIEAARVLHFGGSA